MESDTRAKLNEGSDAKGSHLPRWNVEPPRASQPQFPTWWEMATVRKTKLNGEGAFPGSSKGCSPDRNWVPKWSPLLGELQDFISVSASSQRWKRTHWFLFQSSQRTLSQRPLCQQHRLEGQGETRLPSASKVRVSQAPNTREKPAACISELWNACSRSASLHLCESESIWNSSCIKTYKLSHTESQLGSLFLWWLLFCLKRISIKKDHHIHKTDVGITFCGHDKNNYKLLRWQKILHTAKTF